MEVRESKYSSRGGGFGAMIWSVLLEVTDMFTSSERVRVMI